MRRRRWPLVVVFAALSLLAAACDEAEETAKQTGARTSAEAFRVSVKAQDTEGDPGGVRNIQVLREAADDLPGGPDVLGINDGDGDGIDDDGFVEVSVDKEFACVTLPESGDDVDVSGGRCS
jgi:hypothetical protein